ncbi:MAG: type II secretion system minor pseudopilin GspK [Deltaproteobacteria bacterium]|nr:type II secretion system minor pseudopilin GspK [Deltaproteobacteria bacterium]
MRSAWSNRRGVALIIVLLMVSIIVALTIQFNRDTRSEVYGAANVSDGIRLRYIAESGFYVGEALLLADKTPFDGLTEPWANTEMIALKSEEFFDNGAFKLAIQDEGGKIPVNSLVSGNAYNPLIRDLLLRLLTGPHFRLEQRRAEELGDAIKDWIDADDEVTGGGAEGAYYAGLAKPYAGKNAPIDCIEELLMVKGVTRELFYGMGESPGLVQCMTVFGDGRININTAPRPVLRALATEMADGELEWLDQYRRDARNDLAEAGWHQRIPRASGINILPQLIKINSEIFQITAVGLQGRMTGRITAVVQRQADRRKIKLLSWKVE